MEYKSIIYIAEFGVGGIIKVIFLFFALYSYCVNKEIGHFLRTKYKWSNSFFVKINESKSFIPRKSQAFPSCSVIRISAEEGFKFPLGWLCAIITAVPLQSKQAESNFFVLITQLVVSPTPIFIQPITLRCLPKINP